jgi:hypothetical protein
MPQPCLRQQLRPAPEAARLAREILWTRVLVFFGLFASIFAMSGLMHMLAFRLHRSAWTALIDAGFAANISFLMYGRLFYQITRLAYLKRLREHRRLTRALN